MKSGISGFLGVGSGVTTPGSGITTRGIGISFGVLVESGIKILNVLEIRDQNFLRFGGAGIKISGKNTESVMKKYTSLRP